MNNAPLLARILYMQHLEKHRVFLQRFWLQHAVKISRHRETPEFLVTVDFAKDEWLRYMPDEKD